MPVLPQREQHRQRLCGVRSHGILKNERTVAKAQKPRERSKRQSWDVKTVV